MRQEAKSALEKVSKTGSDCLEQFSKLEPTGSYSIVFAATLIKMKGWFSVRCDLQWRVKTTALGRRYVQLYAPPSRRSAETGLLPTPIASEGKRGSGRKLSIVCGTPMNISAKGVKYGVSLQQLAGQGFLPTPVTADATTGAIMGSNDQFRTTSGLPRKINRNGKDGSVGLARLVQLLRMLPTPLGRDYIGGRHPDTLRLKGRKPSNSICDTINAITGKCSKLNPMFVMEMMGFPIGWTVLPFLRK